MALFHKKEAKSENVLEEFKNNWKHQEDVMHILKDAIKKEILQITHHKPTVHDPRQEQRHAKVIIEYKETHKKAKQKPTKKLEHIKVEHEKTPKAVKQEVTGKHEKQEKPHEKELPKRKEHPKPLHKRTVEVQQHKDKIPGYAKKRLRPGERFAPPSEIKEIKQQIDNLEQGIEPGEHGIFKFLNRRKIKQAQEAALQKQKIESELRDGAIKEISKIKSMPSDLKKISTANKIFRIYIREKYGIGRGLTYEELMKTLRTHKVDLELKKRIVEISKKVNEFEYGGLKITQQEVDLLIKRIEEFFLAT